MTTDLNIPIRDRSRRVVSPITRGIERLVDLSGWACSTIAMLLLLTTPTLGLLVPIALGLTGFALSGLAFTARIERRQLHLRRVVQAQRRATPPSVQALHEGGRPAAHPMLVSTTNKSPTGSDHEHPRDDLHHRREARRLRNTIATP